MAKRFKLVSSAELRAHKADVRALCSHEGSLASTGYDGMVHFWDLSRSDVPITSLRGSASGRLLALCDIPNHKLIASSGLDGVISLWDMGSAKCVATLEGHVSSVSALVARPQSHELFSGGGDEHVLIWDLRSYQGASSLRGQATSSRALAFGAADETLFTGGGDGQVRAWNCKRDQRASVQSYYAVEVLRGPLFGVTSLVYDDAHAMLASAGMDNVIYCWDLSKHSQFTPEGRIRMASRVLRGHTGIVNAVVSWGERGLLSASADGTICAWDPLAGDDESAFVRAFTVSSGPLTASVRAMHVLDAKRMCTGTSDGTVQLWLAIDESHG